MPIAGGKSTTASKVLALAICAIGILIVARTIAAGGGAVSTGVILGLIFAAVGAGRLYLACRPPG